LASRFDEAGIPKVAITRKLQYAFGMIADSTITYPKCGYKATEHMPTKAAVGPNFALVLPEGRKYASIHASLAVIRRIPVTVIPHLPGRRTE